MGERQGLLLFENKVCGYCTFIEWNILCYMTLHEALLFPVGEKNAFQKKNSIFTSMEKKKQGLLSIANHHWG